MKPLKRVLIITYYWPPSGGSGVQRWLKFSKYLPEHGWQPVIYTPENPEMPSVDESLLKDIPEEADVWSALQKSVSGEEKGARLDALLCFVCRLA